MTDLFAEEFDLSNIPDDREDTIPQVRSDLQPKASAAGGFDGTADMARRTDLTHPVKGVRNQKENGTKQSGKKKRGRKRRTSSDHTSNDTANDVLARNSLSTQNVPAAVEEDRPLRDTEPETYHIYATSDQSDVEDGDDDMRAPVTNGFIAVNKSPRKSISHVSEADAEDTESEEEDDMAVAQPPKPELDTEVEAPHVPTSTAAAHFAEVNILPSTKIPAPIVNDLGRFLCPFADVYDCTVTLVDKKGAIRHAKGHLKTTAAVTQGATAVSEPVAHESATAHRSLPPEVTQTPIPKVNSEGRFLCPFVDAEGCDKTFKKKETAVRHANVHTNQFVCSVCKKPMSRQDSLIKHMNIHSDSELAAATNVDGEANPEQVEEKQDVLDMLEEAVESEKLDEESSTEFVTPQSIPLQQDEQQKTSPEEFLEEAMEVVDTEMVEAEPVEDASADTSERQSSTPPSVFNEADTIVKETPMPAAKVKRKRAAEDPVEETRSSPERKRARRRASPGSPPTSIPSNDAATRGTPKSSNFAAAARRGQASDKIIPRLQTRQGSMDGWAQKFTPGSKLKHPTLNPTPPRPDAHNIQVVIPHTSQVGPSRARSKRRGHAAVDGAAASDAAGTRELSLEGPQRKKSRKEAYTTPKGKKRAEPGVEYSTPAKDTVANGDDGPEADAETSEADASEAEDTSPANIATSVAKRTFPEQAEEDDPDSDFDVTRAPESEDETAPQGKPTRPAPRIKEARQSSGVRRSEPQNPADRVECVRCHRMLASEKALRKHQKKPSSHVGLLKCHGCTEEFFAVAALARHQKDTGHGKGNGLQGNVGAFSEKEVNKLNRWRDQFCEYHNISEYEFNDMMTQTLERGKGASWSWAFVTKAAFLKDYISVLPNRNKRSMLRYRERNFQNLEGMKNWTTEDDLELIRLQKELGSKYTEIARRLGRTADAVSQRWRHKLQYGEVETGEWSKAECAKFGKVLSKIRAREDGDDIQDQSIPWNKVSEMMGTRSAQQCSNHYRAMHFKKDRGQWVKISAMEKKDGSSRILTPSKMDLRLSGQTSGRKSSRKGLSEEFIRDDDEENEANDEGEAAEDVEADDDEARDHELANQEPEAECENDGKDQWSLPSDDEDDSNRPTRSRDPLLAKTPGKSLRSSQLFEQTQANTSGLKPSQRNSRNRRGQPSQDRPSPNIPIQRQRTGPRSPLGELLYSENGELDDEEEQQADEGDEAQRQQSSQELGTLIKADKNEAEADDEVDEKTSADESAAEDEMVKTESSDEESADVEVEARDDDDVIRTEGDAEEELVDTETKEEDEESAKADDSSQATDDEETQSADEAGTESASESESEASDASDEEDPMPEQEQPTSSFMASNNESAGRANIKKVRTGSGSQSQSQMQTVVPGSLSGRRRRDVWR